MRKLVWLLVVLCALTTSLWLLTTHSTAQAEQHKDVQGTLTNNQNGNPVGNHVIQARPTSSYNWSDVATTDGNGHYTWDPDGQNAHYWMRAKNGCGLQGDGWRAADSGDWWYYITGTATATVNLTAKDCFESK